MFRLSLMSIFLFSFLAGALVVSAQQDYVDQLIQLTELTAKSTVSRGDQPLQETGIAAGQQWE